MNKRSLVIDVRMIYHSGIGTYLQNLIPHLSSSFEVITLGDESLLSHFNWFTRKTHISLNSPIYSIREQINLHQKIPAVNLFWTPHFNIPILPIAAQKRIVTIHDVFHLASSSHLSLLKKWYAKLLINTAVNKSEIVITVSQFSKKEIIKYTNIKAKKIYVIPNGINKTVFKVYTDLVTLSKVREEYNLPKKFLLYVGNIKPHKNLKKLLLAFQIVTKQWNDYHLVLVGQKEGFISGDKNLFEIIKQDKELQKKVHFTGFVPNNKLAVILNLAELFIFPSLYEGFGLPPLEAMACGCPTIVSNIGSITEVCGEASLYFNPIKSFDIAETIKKLLEDKKLREKYISKGFERTESFSWEISAKKHLELFEKL